jgi:hypothetical protein
MWQIRKYKLPTPNSKGYMYLRLLYNYRILDGFQDDVMVVWVLEDTTRQEFDSCYLVALNTGNTLDKIRNLKHLRTITSLNGIVWHLFHEVNDATD